jgi:hypothetical protein
LGIRNAQEPMLAQSKGDEVLLGGRARHAAGRVSRRYSFWASFQNKR